MKIKKVLSLVLVFMLLLSTTSAFAAVPEGTIVFGNVAYDLQALADDSFTSEILGNYRDNNNDFAYKKIGGEWVNSLNNETTPELPATITLKKGDGTTEIITVEEPTGELKVVEVSAIDRYGVTVTFEATTEDNDEANVVVKDGEGNVIETEAMLIAEGSTSATFDFVTPFAADYDFTGVWTVNGVEYSFDAIKQLADIAAAVANENEIELQAALDAAGITYVDELKIGEYLAALDADALETLETVQEAINEVDKAAADGEVNAAKVKAVADAKTQAQLLTALTANFNHVNPDWIVDYATHETNGLLGKTVEELVSADAIQGNIYAVNLAAIDADEPTTAAEQAQHTALIEAWMKPDAEGETDKEEKIADSKLAEAAYKVLEATTANRLYNALVAFADLADDDTVIDIEDIKEENKQYYFDVVNPEEGQYNVPEAGITAAPADIVTAGNTAAGIVQSTLDARIKSFTVYTRQGASNSTNGPNYKLAYGSDLNVEVSEGRTVKSLVIEYYKDKELLGTLELKDPKRAGTVGTGTLDIFGDYDSNSWAGTWNAGLTDFPTKSVLKVEFDDGVAEKPFVLTLTDEQKQPFFVEALNRTETQEEMSAAIVELEAVMTGQSVFTNLPSADKLIVAERVLEARNDIEDNLVVGGITIPNTAGKFFNDENKLDASYVLEQVEVFTDARTALLNGLNGVGVEKPENINDVKVLLAEAEDVLPEYAELTAVEQTNAAEAVLNALNAFESGEQFNTLAAVKTAAGL